MLQRIILLLVLLCIQISSYAQTTVVQAFTYQSTTRDTVITFPTGDHNQYEKIWMVYSMRCKDGLVSPPVSGQTNIGCGEWDYSCNTFITDSSRVDSFHSISPSHLITGFEGDVFEYTTQPTYTYYQSTQQEIVYNNTISENEYSIGNGSNEASFPFGENHTSARTQLLYFADALITQGLQSGDITGLKLDLNDAATGYDKLRIRMKHSNKSSLDAATIDNSGFQEVYYLDSDLSVGNHFFKFHNPFNWNGSDNLLIDISYLRHAPASSTNVSSGTQTYTAALSADATNDQYLEVDGSGFVEVDHALPTIQNEITVSFWVKGADVLPQNTTIFEGLDADNRRQMNVHLPWSNGRIYWDCGNDGGGYDRIDKAASANEIKNNWNHFAFTKNATSGQMRIYLNGNLWHSGSGKTNPIDVQRFRIANAVTNHFEYPGKIDDFQIWDVALDEATIREWMSKTLDSSHPQYSHLVANYTFDNDNGTSVNDSSPNALHGELENAFVYRNWEGRELEKNISASMELPNLVLVQGEYDTEVIETTILDSLINIPNLVEEYTVVGTDLVLVSSNFYYASGAMPIYDEQGNEVGTVNVAAENNISISELEHYTKRPARYEIMSFVTPYGINLDLGIEGKSWLFDVTDFGPILKGNKRIFMSFGGQWQEDNDIKFLFVEGTPSRNVIDISQVWPVSAENHNTIIANGRFEPRNMQLPADADAVKVRATITGHGQEGEFIPRTHFLNIDGGSKEFQWEVWKECADNPIYPQGGTWIYDRAGWCPGAASDTYEHYLTDYANPGDEIELDYGVNTAAGDSRYIVNIQMVSYAAPNFALDAELLDILNPSNKVEHSRFNPMCGEPRILIRNNGSTPLTSLLISYDVDGQNSQDFTWTGNLGYLETEEVALPLLPKTAFATENGTFHVSLSQPNSGSDEYANNNSMETDFKVVPMLGKDVVVRMFTNSAAHETAYYVFDAEGNLLASKAGGLSAGTLYADTLFDLNGCYRLLVEDSGEDGIAWWANNDGNGNIRIKSLGSNFTTLEPDFGKFIQYEFYAGDIYTPTYEVINKKAIEIFPNPTEGLFHLNLLGYLHDVEVEVLNAIGQVIERVHLRNRGAEILEHTFNMQRLNSGTYFLKIYGADGTEIRKVVKME